MKRVLLDTDILSEYLKGHDRTVAANAEEYLREHRVFTFTSVTVHEIVFGLTLKGAVAQLARAVAWLEQNDEITPTADDFREAARIKALARRRGLVVEMPDCLIAAMAVRLGMPVITGNTRDFEMIRESGIPLELENWRG